MRSILIVIVFFSANLFSQEPIKTAPAILQDQEGKTYVNRDLGLFLWISSSPDPDAEKVLLKSDSTASYTNPMYLDTEGYNTFRSPWAVNPKSKRLVYPPRDVVFEVYSDGLAPKTKVYFGKRRPVIVGNVRHFKNSIEVHLKSYDGVSGIERTYYSINEGSFMEYNSPILLDSEGGIKLKYYSVDRVGNREEIQEMDLVIEKAPSMPDN